MLLEYFAMAFCCVAIYMCATELWSFLDNRNA